jgi:hypothetical protein
MFVAADEKNALPATWQGAVGVVDAPTAQAVGPKLIANPGGSSLYS